MFGSYIQGVGEADEASRDRGGDTGEATWLIMEPKFKPRPQIDHRSLSTL